MIYFRLGDEEDRELNVFLQDTDRLELAGNINEAITGYDARDEIRICPFTKPDGTCYKGKHCKLEHVALSRGELFICYFCLRVTKEY